jgi:DNA-binding response OmpR family regulator
MSRKTIVLADNSYTIRRIVELSFSDETDIELVTFENGSNLKEKLVELRPQIILVDIKLPEFNGYEVCKFVQGSEALKQTKVFLLKGGFEPIDENLLQGLKYENIITKPFDSNALVSNIKKLLEKMPGQTPADAAVEIPSSLPEDEELIESIPETPKDISFSDVKEEIDSDEILPDEDELIHAPGGFPDDEVLPSEEITRAQPEKDTISPTLDEDDNPFEEEAQRRPLSPTDEEETSLTEEELNIKHNIEMQEKDLEIDSLTLEEINIKRDIERQERERGLLQEEPEADMGISDEGEELEADTSDMFPNESKPEPQEPQEDFFSFDKKKTKPMESGPTMFEADEKDMFSREGDQEPEEIPDIKYETDMGRKSILEFEPPPGEVTLLPEAEPHMPETISSTEMELSEPESLSQIEEAPGPEAIDFESDRDTGEEAVEFATEVTAGIPGVREYEISDLEISSPPPPARPKVKVKEEKIPEPEMEVPIAPKTPKPTPQPKQVVKEELAPEDLDFMEIPKPPQPPEPPPRPQPTRITEEEIAPEILKIIRTPQAPKTPEARPAPAPTPETKQIPKIQQEEILNKIEHKLTHAIKEMLWEIVPPLAEKIIKKEIETLTSEAEKSVK